MGYYIPVRVVEDRYRGPERTEGSDQSSERRGRAGVKPLVAESSQQLRGEPAVQADASAEARGQNVGSDDVHGSSVNQNDGNIPTSARSAKYGSRAVHTYERQLGDDRHVPASVDGQSHTTEHADSQTAENEAQPAVEREHDREMSDRDESRNDVAGDRVDSEQEERRGNRTEDPERERPQAAEQTETSENKVAAENHRAAGHEETRSNKSLPNESALSIGRDRMRRLKSTANRRRASGIMIVPTNPGRTPPSDSTSPTMNPMPRPT